MSRDTQQASVGMEQGANRLFIKSGGFFNVNDQDISGTNLRLRFLSESSITYHTSADTSSGSVISPAYGHHLFSAATTQSLGQITLPAAVAGAKLMLNGDKLVGDANISVLTATSAAVLNQGSVALSSFEISAIGYVDLVCVSDGTWAIVRANILEHAAA